MQVTFALTTQEASAILAEHFAIRHSLMRSEINIVIGEVDHVQNIQEATIKMRIDLINRIASLLPSTKISAIKEFRQMNQNADLKQSRIFIESPHMWEQYIKTGEYM